MYEKYSAVLKRQILRSRVRNRSALFRTPALAPDQGVKKAFKQKMLYCTYAYTHALRADTAKEKSKICLK